MKITIDQAVLIFQMILAQHADKTWGDICEMFDVKANEHDRDIKLSDSNCECLWKRTVVIDSLRSENYLIRFDSTDAIQFVCFGEFDNGEAYKKIKVKELISVISFEDKV
jgi:hypothetical protein